MSDNININEVNKRIRKVASIAEKDCTNSLLGDGLIKYFNEAALINGTEQFDINNVQHWSKLKVMHICVKVPINYSKGMKNKQIIAEHLLYLDCSDAGYDLFRNSYADCLKFLYDKVYSSALYMGSAIDTEWIHWKLNLEDDSSMLPRVISSRGYIRPQDYLRFLIIFLGIKNDGTVDLDQARRISIENGLVSSLFLDEFEGI